MSMSIPGGLNIEAIKGKFLELAKQAHHEASGGQRVVSAHAAAMANVEAHELIRPSNIRSTNAADPTTVYASGDPLDLELKLAKGFVYSGMTVCDKDADNWVLVSLEIGALVVKPASDPPANLASFLANRERHSTIAAYVMSKSTDALDVKISLKSLENSNKFRGWNIEGVDQNQSCALDEYTQEVPRSLGLRLAAPVVSAISRGLFNRGSGNPLT